MKRVLVLALTLVLLLAGCSQTATPDTTQHVPTPTAAPVTVVPRDTPEPSPEPTETSEPTEKPNYDALNSLDDLVNLDFILSIEQIVSNAETLDAAERYFYGRDEENADQLMYSADSYSRVSSEGVVCLKFRYESTGDSAYYPDGCEVLGYAAAPADYLETAYPVLILNRLGWQDNGLLSDNDVQFYVKSGFIVLATQYRGANGGTGKDEFGGADVDDVIKLIDIAELFAFTNGKIYMYGHERGGMETYIALKRDDRIDAAATYAATADLVRDYATTPYLARYRNLIGNLDSNKEKYIERSALYWYDEINTPLLIAHGTGVSQVTGDVVSSLDAEELFTAMSDAGKDVELKLYEGFDPYDGGAVFRDILHWLRQH